MGRKRREDGRNARTEASRKYSEKSYDRLNIYVRKGQRERVKEYAAERGESVGGMINRLLAAEIPGFDAIGEDDGPGEK